MVAVCFGARLQRGGVGAGIGLGQREGHDQFAAGHARQVVGLLVGRAVHQDALRADADVGAEHRAEGRRGAAELEVDLNLLAHREADPAELFGHRQAEKAQLLHRFDQLGRHLVVLFEMVLERHQALAHEALNGGQQDVERFAIECHGHVSLPIDVRLNQSTTISRCCGAARGYLAYLRNSGLRFSFSAATPSRDSSVS